MNFVEKLNLEIKGTINVSSNTDILENWINNDVRDYRKNEKWMSSDKIFRLLDIKDDYAEVKLNSFINDMLTYQFAHGTVTLLEDNKIELRSFIWQAGFRVIFPSAIMLICTIILLAISLQNISLIGILVLMIFNVIIVVLPWRIYKYSIKSMYNQMDKSIKNVLQHYI